jgi:hypothetical protein
MDNSGIGGDPQPPTIANARYDLLAVFGKRKRKGRMQNAPFAVTCEQMF